MTKVTFYQNSENQCVGFTSEDHAGYAQEGEDLSLIHIYYNMDSK